MAVKSYAAAAAPSSESTVIVPCIRLTPTIDEESLRSSLSGAFDASTYEEFVSGFGTSITDTVRNAIVQAFMESAAMSAVLKKLSDAIFAALQDGNIDATEMAGIEQLSKEAEKLGGELYKLLEKLGLTVKKGGGGGGGPEYSKWSMDKLYRERQKAADEGRKKRREEIELEIKARLQIGVEDLRNQLRSAFDSTSFGEFNKKWGESLRETTRNALITAFLEGAVMGPLLKQLSDQLMVAMADGTLSADEKAGINETKGQISEEAKIFFKMLQEIGLGFKAAKKEHDYSKDNIDQLYRKSGRGNKKATEEIKARLKIDVDSLKGDLRSAFDSTSLGAFHKSFGEALHETTRNALITAFMESAVMAPLLTALSNTIMAAVKDKNISEGEKAQIREDQAAIMAVAGPFFEALKAAGFGFKPKNEYDPSKDSIEKLYQRSNRGNKKAREEIDARLKIDVGTVRGALEQAFESTNLSAFHKNFGAAMRDITRNAMIAAFLESAVMQTLFKTFSTTIRAALADGMISSGEMKNIKADQKAIADAAAPFFTLLKSLGLGFKAPAQAPDYGEMSWEKLWGKYGKAKGKRKLEIEAEIKGRLELSKDDIAGQFRSALDSVSFGDFKRNWGKSLRETTRNALIAAFMETSRMQGLFDRLGDVAAKAMKDGRISKGERAAIGGVANRIQAEGKAVMQLLDSLGLGFEEEISNLSLDELWKQWSKDPGNKELTAEIKARLSIDTEAFKGAVASAFDQPSLKEFGLNLEKNVKQSVRDGLIAAFMESAAMKPLLDKLSNDTMAALKDGTLTQKELDGLLKTGGQIKDVGQTFFDTLDDLGLSFKDLNDKVGQVSESLTNVPSGFKVAYARFQAADPVVRGGGEMKAMPVSVSGQLGSSVAGQFQGATIIVQPQEGFDVDVVVSELERRGALTSGNRFGTPIVRSRY